MLKNKYFLIFLLDLILSISAVFKIYLYKGYTIENIEYIQYFFLFFFIVVPFSAIVIFFTWIGIFLLINFVKKNISYHNDKPIKESSFETFMRNHSFENTGTYFEKNINGRQVLINNTYNNLIIRVLYKIKGIKNRNLNSAFIFNSDSVSHEFKLQITDNFNIILSKIDEINVILDNENL